MRTKPSEHAAVRHDRRHWVSLWPAKHLTLTSCRLLKVITVLMLNDGVHSKTAPAAMDRGEP